MISYSLLFICHYLLSLYFFVVVVVVVAAAAASASVFISHFDFCYVKFPLGPLVKLK